MAAVLKRRETPRGWVRLFLRTGLVAASVLPLLDAAEEPDGGPESLLAGLEVRLPEEPAAVMEAVSGLLAQADAWSAEVRAEAYIVRGKAHWLLVDLEAALGDYLAALALADPVEDPVRYGRILINAGAVHYRMEAFAEAETLFREALSIAETQGVERMRAAAWANLALLLTETGYFAKARRKFRWAGEFYERRGELEELARVLHNEGILEREAGDYGAAVERFERAVGIHRSRGDYPEVARSMRHRAEAYMLMGLPEAAALQAEVALEILRGRDLPMLSTPIHAVLAEAYAESGRWEEALAAERAHGRGRREVMERRQSATLEQARLRFQAELDAGREQVREAEAALTKTELYRARAELARRTWQLAAMAALGVLLLVVIVGLVLCGRFRARTNRELRNLNDRLKEALARARAVAENAEAADRAPEAEAAPDAEKGGAPPGGLSRGNPLVALIDPVATSRRILSIYLDQTGAAAAEGSEIADLERIRVDRRCTPDLCIIDEEVLAGPPGGAAAELPAGFERVPVLLLVRANGAAPTPAVGNITVLRKPVRRSGIEEALRRLAEPAPPPVSSAARQK